MSKKVIKEIDVSTFSPDKIRILNACIAAIKFAKDDVKYFGDIEETCCGSYPDIMIHHTNISSELFINGKNVTDPLIEW